MTAIDVFGGWAASRTNADNYARASCGHASFLWRAADEFRRDASGAGRTMLIAALETPSLAARVSEANGTNPDRTVPARAAGFAAALKGDWSAAAAALESGFSGSTVNLSNYSPDPDQTNPSGAAYPAVPVNRVGGWMALDVFWHLQHSAPGVPIPHAGDILAREQTPLLLAGGSGHVLALTAEVLSGPPGLVTPDWWPMGLMQFPTPPPSANPEEAAHFVTAVQRVLTAVWAGQRHRVRWRIEPFSEGQGLPVNVEGPSAEAAAGCLGLALRDRLRSGESALVLNRGMAVTARVNLTPTRADELGLRPVKGLHTKFQAAHAAGLSEVILAGETPDPLPTTVPGHRVLTLGDAYFEMQLTNEYVRNHQRRMYAPFDPENPDRKWDLEETPQ